MKLVVREEFLEGIGLAVVALVIIAATGAGAGATYLIAIGLCALRMLWRLRFGDLREP
jgi:hypothetical protein